MPEIVLTVGPAGCGKTTYREQYPDHYVVSPDEIRFMILNTAMTGQYYDQEREPLIWQLVFRELEDALLTDDNIFFDATNTTFARRYPVVARARKFGYTIRYLYFKIPLWLILHRNLNRSDLRPPVPEEAVARHFFQLHDNPPREWEYDSMEIIMPSRDDLKIGADSLSTEDLSILIGWWDIIKQELAVSDYERDVLLPKLERMRGGI